MIRIVVRGEHEANTLEFAKMFAEKLRVALQTEPCSEERAKNPQSSDCGSVNVCLGPAPAPFAKLRNLYRFHIHLRSELGERLRETVRTVSLALKTPPEIQWIIDVDPVDML